MKPFRSGRTSDGEGSGGVGNIFAQGTEYENEEDPDWVENYDGPVDVIRDDDEPAQPFIDALMEACERINDLEIPYNPNGPNSNSTVRELLEEIGEPPPSKRPMTRGWKKNIEGVGSD